MTEVGLVIRSFLSHRLAGITISADDLKKLDEYALDRGGWAAVVTDRKLIFVGSKLLKVAASDFCFQSFPTADTEKLTALVAHCLMQHSMLQYFRERHEVERLDILAVALCIVAEVLGTSTAASLVVPYFRHAVESNRHSLDVPQVICSLAPGTNLQGLNRHERIAIIQAELAKRGRIVLPARDDEDCGYDDPSQQQYVVEVTYLNQVCGTYRAATATQAHEIAVLNEARSLIAQATRLSRADGTRVAVPSTNRIVTLTMLDDTQYLAHLSWIMKQVRLILRFKNPYEEILRARGHFESILASDGWVPLTILLDLIVEKHHALKSNISDPTEALVLEILDDHDNMQRFEVGVCNSPNSPFAKLRCARALYAHELAAQSTSLFVNILSQWERPVTCPPTAWALVDRKVVKEFGTRGFKLFDQCAFVTLVETKYLSEFAEYGKRPLSQQFDEKIRNDNVFFLEVNLAAVMKDPQMTVKQHPPRGDRTGHFIVLPSGPRYNFSFKKKNVPFSKAELHFFPIALLTRRCCEVRNAAPAISEEAASAAAMAGDQHRVVFGTIPIPPDPIVVFEPGELDVLLAGTISSDGSEAGAAGSDGNAAAGPSGIDLLLKEPMEIVRLDEQPIKDQIQAFHQDPNRVNLLLLVPKIASSGASFFARLTALKTIKEYITSLGMTYRERSRGTNAKSDEFLISKPQAFPQAVIEEIANEIGVKFSNISLLREAVTRECVNKQENYERLEFIGDAVLDWIVAYDASRTIADYSVITTVTTDVCRNDVLCLVLPRSLHVQLLANYGEDLAGKTRADMFESIVGALYEDQQGLDAIRGVVAALFQQIPNVFTSASPEERLVLNGAKRGCPYLVSGHLAILQSIPYKCARVVPPSLVENLEDLHQIYQEDGSSSSSSRRKPFETFASHAASTGFPRIQDKDFATHFTTGTVYSYRRITQRDYRMHNRILSLFHEGKVAYVNETLGKFLPFTLDIDGTGILSFGLADMIALWASERYGQLGAMGVVLDCSGKSVVSKKMKRSCHVHFPQITLTIDELRKATIDLRHFIVETMEKLRYPQCVAEEQKCSLLYWPGKIAKTNLSVMKSSHPSSGPVIIVGRIVCNFRLLRHRCEEEGIQLGQGTNVFFSHLSIVELLRLTGVSKLWRRQALAKVLLDIERPPSYLMDMMPPDDPSCAKNGEDDGPKLNHYVLLRPLAPPHFASFVPFPAADPLSALRLVPVKRLSIIADSNDVKDFLEFVVQPSLVASGARKQKEKEYFEDVLKPMLEQDNYGLEAWTKFIDPGLCESKKLRMYLCDKFDTVYKQEFRPLLQFALLKPSSRHASSASAVLPTPKDQPVIPHASMLRLTSLRSPTYKDIEGNTYEAWDTNPEPTPVCRQLPSFETLRTVPHGEKKPATSDWGLFTGSTMAIAPSSNSVLSEGGGSGKVVRHAALYPSWWSYRRLGPEGGVARFIVAGEVYAVFAGVNFSSCVAEGLKAVAKEVTPHVDVEGEWRMPSTATDDFLPMFAELKGLRRGPQQSSSTAQAAAAPSMSMALAIQQQQQQAFMLRSLSNTTARIRSQTRRFTYLSDGGNVHPHDIPSIVSARICGEPVAVLYVVNSVSSLLLFTAMKPRPFVLHVRALPRPNATFRVVVVADDVEHEMWPRVLQACARDGLVVVQSKALRDQLRLTLANAQY